MLKDRAETWNGVTVGVGLGVVVGTGVTGRVSDSEGVAVGVSVGGMVGVGVTVTLGVAGETSVGGIVGVTGAVTVGVRGSVGATDGLGVGTTAVAVRVEVTASVGVTTAVPVRTADVPAIDSPVSGTAGKTKSPSPVGDRDARCDSASALLDAEDALLRSGIELANSDKTTTRLNRTAANLARPEE
jgi:hypothetical protein